MKDPGVEVGGSGLIVGSKIGSACVVDVCEVRKGGKDKLLATDKLHSIVKSIGSDIENGKWHRVAQSCWRVAGSGCRIGG